MIIHFSDLALIRTNFLNAHFYLIRRGSRQNVGRPAFDYSPYHSEVKIIDESVMAKFMFYVCEKIFLDGYWQVHCYGTLNLVHIRVSDVRKIEFERA